LHKSTDQGKSPWHVCKKDPVKPEEGKTKLQKKVFCENVGWGETQRFTTRMWAKDKGLNYIPPPQRLAICKLFVNKSWFMYFLFSITSKILRHKILMYQTFISGFEGGKLFWLGGFQFAYLEFKFRFKATRNDIISDHSYHASIVKSRSICKIEACYLPSEEAR